MLTKNQFYLPQSNQLSRAMVESKDELAKQFPNGADVAVLGMALGDPVV